MLIADSVFEVIWPRLSLTFEAIVTNKLLNHFTTVNGARLLQRGAYNLQLISACAKRVWLHETSINSHLIVRDL